MNCPNFKIRSGRKHEGGEEALGHGQEEVIGDLNERSLNGMEVQKPDWSDINQLAVRVKAMSVQSAQVTNTLLRHREQLESWKCF